LIFDIY